MSIGVLCGGLDVGCQVFLISVKPAEPFNTISTKHVNQQTNTPLTEGKRSTFSYFPQIRMQTDGIKKNFSEFQALKMPTCVQNDSSMKETP